MGRPTRENVFTALIPTVRHSVPPAFPFLAPLPISPAAPRSPDARTCIADRGRCAGDQLRHTLPGLWKRPRVQLTRVRVHAVDVHLGQQLRHVHVGLVVLRADAGERHAGRLRPEQPRQHVLHELGAAMPRQYPGPRAVHPVYVDRVLRPDRGHHRVLTCARLAHMLRGGVMQPTSTCPRSTGPTSSACRARWPTLLAASSRSCGPAATTLWRRASSRSALPQPRPSPLAPQPTRPRPPLTTRPHPRL